LLQNAQTTAVFQLESRGMKELISRLKPDCFDDIIALVALYRPGPLESGMVDDYVKVKHGQQAAEYAHPLLIPVLKPTNGVILYQEQVMQIAREMASYTLGGADMLRRAMGKKKPEEMAKERDKFLSGSIENKISQDIANYVFDLMEKFAGYGFNKSHSAAYALVAYQTAWLKAHYPAEFMAAVLSADMDNTDKIVVLVEECRQMKLTVCPPNVNLSEHQFTVNTAGQIVYGLGAIKGAGQSALDDLLAERRENGDFSSFYDLCKRVVNRKVNRRVMESLIKSGAFDSLDDNPAKLFAQLPEALRMAEQYGKSAATGQNDFFGMMNEEAETADPVFEITHVEPWTMRERLESEKITLGLYLTGHPIDQYEQELKNFTSGKIAKLIEDAEKSRNKMDAKIAGFLVNIQKYDNRAILTLDDRSARLEITAYSEVYEKYRNLLSKDSLLVIDISFPVKNEYSNSRPTVKAIYDMEQARATFANGLFFEWSVQHNPCSTLEFMQTLREILVPFRGGECRLIMRYVSANAVANLVLGDEWKVHVSDELLVRLQRFSVISGVEVKYK
jgi:DNA polymerase-3 subunit alpha